MESKKRGDATPDPQGMAKKKSMKVVGETTMERVVKRIANQEKLIADIENRPVQFEKERNERQDCLQREKTILLFFEFMQASLCGKQAILNLSATPKDKWPHLLGLYLKERSTRISLGDTELTDYMCDLFEKDLETCGVFEGDGLSEVFVRNLFVIQLGRQQTQEILHMERKEGRMLVHYGNKNPVTCAEERYFSNRVDDESLFISPKSDEGANWIIVANKKN